MNFDTSIATAYFPHKEDFESSSSQSTTFGWSSISSHPILLLGVLLIFVASLMVTSWLTWFSPTPTSPSTSSTRLAMVKKTVSDFLPSPTAGPEPTPTATPMPTPTPLPQRIRVPKINIDTRIIEVGYVEETGEMEVPADANDIGWYRYGPPPGVNGGSVLAGHFDTPTGAPAIFYSLGDLVEGDTFSILNDKNEELVYRVSQVLNVDLDTFPRELIFGEKQASQVTLITCSGVWDPVGQIYSNRLAVIGELEAIEPLEYIASAEEDEAYLEQFVVQGFAIEQGERKANLEGAYLRLEADNSKISVYLASDNQEVVAMDAVIKFDPTLITLDPEAIAFTQEFAAHHAIILNPGLMQVSLFTDLNWNSQSPLNTTNQEFKVAELYYTVNSQGRVTTPIELLTHDPNIRSSVVLKPAPGIDIHQSIDILNSVEGTTIPL